MKMPRLGGSYVAAGAFSFLSGIYNLKVQEHQMQHALKGQKLLAQGVWGIPRWLRAYGAYLASSGRMGHTSLAQGVWGIPR